MYVNIYDSRIRNIEQKLHKICMTEFIQCTKFFFYYYQRAFFLVFFFIQKALNKIAISSKFNSEKKTTELSINKCIFNLYKKREIKKNMKHQNFPGIF